MLEHVLKPHILLQSENLGYDAQRLKLAISTDMSRFPPGRLARDSLISRRKRVSGHALEIVTKSVKETQKVAAQLISEAAKKVFDSALVIALEGELGSGKTTFVQGLAKALGVEEKVLSPTFVLMKVYPLKQRKFQHLIHIDCYRIDSPKDLLHLGFREILKYKDAIILIEWAERVKRFLPKDVVKIYFSHLDKNKRIIKIN